LKKISITYLVILFFIPCIIYAQELNNLRTKVIPVNADTIQLDTSSIISNSIQITDTSGNKIDSNLYTIDYMRGQLIWKPEIKDRQSTINVSYRIFPYNFSETYQHKDIKSLEPDMSSFYNPFASKNPKQTDDIFNLGGLSKSGSISRGISFGNNQDVVVNSSLNMQLAGKLSDDIEILAAITDDNIPIQPEGNTQQIQEFDKVFIQLSNKNSKLIAGDFELQRPKSYFMNFYKKAQGGSFNTSFNTLDKDSKSTGIMRIATSAAISKGKYARNEVTAIEGVLGPYKLRGANNESFIIVLSGTEKVYIDGQLMTRGAEYDYVINYNTAEITFTPKNLITKDKRITVEFEYSEKNYARSLLFAGTEYENKKLKLQFNAFSEQDMKNQPIQQELSIDQKKLLSNVGDSLHLAVSPNVDSVAFTSNEVLYKKVDSIIGLDTHTIYIYSTNPDSAIYRVGFSNVGQGNGNYVHKQSLANGKVFEWRAPQAGIPQGSYEPVIALITPKKKQMYTLSADYNISKNTNASVEVALSNEDINTFSKLDSADNVGYALKMNIQSKKPLSKNEEKQWTLISNVNYEWINKDFNPIERYRSVEFERDWNLKNTTIYNDEHIAGINLTLSNKKRGLLNYQLKSFQKGEQYNAVQNIFNTNLNKKEFYLTFNGSLVQSKGLTNTTQFLRQRASLSKKLKRFTVGVKEDQEHNEFRELNTDTLQANSFSFMEYEAFIANADTAINKFSLDYKKRFDLFPRNNAFKEATIGESIGFTASMLKSINSRLTINTSYRKLTIQDSSLTGQKADNSLAGRIEYFAKLLKGSITSNTFYEIASGLEVKKEFSYLKVADGQGVYSWTDYNSNGIEELDEFEIAAFKDQANYIRVYTPTNEYIKTYMNQFNEALNINPAAVWATKKGVKKFISRFSNNSVLSINRKSDDQDLLNAYNPFLAEVSDSTLITLNSNFRSTLYFNRSNPKFGMEVNIQDNKNKSLLTNGFDTRGLSVKGGRFRWNINRKIMFNLTYNDGKKTSSSDYMTSREYTIMYYEAEPKISFQPNNVFRISISYKYADKENTQGTVGEKTINNNIGTDIKYSQLSKANLLFKINYIDISYNVDENTSIAFEMLEGLKTGKNVTWNVSYQKNLSNNLQMSIIYDGRKSPEVKTVHVGSVQVRAYF